MLIWGEKRTREEGNWGCQGGGERVGETLNRTKMNFSYRFPRIFPENPPATRQRPLCHLGQQREAEEQAPLLLRRRPKQQQEVLKLCQKAKHRQEVAGAIGRPQPLGRQVRAAAQELRLRGGGCAVRPGAAPGVVRVEQEAKEGWSDPQVCKKSCSAFNI